VEVVFQVRKSASQEGEGVFQIGEVAFEEEEMIFQDEELLLQHGGVLFPDGVVFQGKYEVFQEAEMGSNASVLRALHPFIGHREIKGRVFANGEYVFQDGERVYLVL
jgi:hypothetical protein